MVHAKNEQISMHNSYLERSEWDTFNMQTESIIGTSNNNGEIFGLLLKSLLIIRLVIGNIAVFHKKLYVVLEGSDIHIIYNGKIVRLRCCGGV
jgi:hypothetical protein